MEDEYPDVERLHKTRWLRWARPSALVLWCTGGIATFAIGIWSVVSPSWVRLRVLPSPYGKFRLVEWYEHEFLMEWGRGYALKVQLAPHKLQLLDRDGDVLQEEVCGCGDKSAVWSHDRVVISEEKCYVHGMEPYPARGRVWSLPGDQE